MQSFSEIVEQITTSVVSHVLGSDTISKYLEGNIPKSALLKYSKLIQEMSHTYTQTKSKKPKLLEDHAAAYALYYLPINLVKCLELMSRTLPHGMDDVNILDFGCGPGTASLAAINSGIIVKSVTLLDESSYMRDLAQKLCAEYLPGTTALEKLSSSVEIPKDRKYELIIAANVLSEINLEKRCQIFADLFDRLSDAGQIIIIEPALKEATQDMMKMRDQILSSISEAKVIYPCTRQDACPMLRESAQDWCHTELRWEIPRLVRQIDELTGFNKHRIKYSAIAFKRGGGEPGGYRVVSIPHKSKIGTSAVLCGKNHYGPVTLPKKQTTDENSIFKKLSLHDKIEVSEIPGGGSLVSESKVSIVP